MTVELRNMMGSCIDRRCSEKFVLHEVEFEIKGDGESWLHRVVEVMAIDPMNAIEIVRESYK